MKKYKIASLFAGIGGIDYGFEQAGANPVWANEIDKYCAITFTANHKKTKLVVDDICNIKGKDIPKVDILTGGFPCQPFSVAGYRKGFEDDRGNMFHQIMRLVDEMEENNNKPRVIFLENVKNLKTHDNNNTFTVIKKELEKREYTVTEEVLNTCEYGNTPQNRERIIIVGFKNHNIKFEFPEPQNINVKLGDILEKAVDPKYTISDKLWASHQRRKKEHQAKGNGFGYCLFNEESKYTSTISARYYKDGSEILIEQKGKNPRKLTPREAARLQGFPDDFKLVVSDMQCYKQFGNSVPTKMIEAVANKVYEALVEGGEIENGN